MPFAPQPPEFVFLTSEIRLPWIVMPLAVPATLMPDAVDEVAVTTPRIVLPVTVAEACWLRTMPRRPIFEAAVAEPIVLPSTRAPVSLPVGPTSAMPNCAAVIALFWYVLPEFAASAMPPSVVPLPLTMPANVVAEVAPVTTTFLTVSLVAPFVDDALAIQITDPDVLGFVWTNVRLRSEPAASDPSFVTRSAPFS